MEEPLHTMKEVAARLARPAHRIIHLCEQGVVRPRVDAQGRGSVRQFSREDVFRILLALWLQEAGVGIPVIKPLMEALDRFMEIKEVKEVRKMLGRYDLVEVIRHVGSDDKPVLAYLTPPARVALVAPRLSVPSRPDVRVDLNMSDRHLVWRGVSIVANLTMIAAGLD
jgi:DNA-binding transcriptional MerR regulator